MGAFVLAALTLQAAEPDDAAIRRFAALLARPATRARGIDRLSHLDPQALRRLGEVDPAIMKAAEENVSLRHSYGPPRLFSLDGREEDLEDILGRLERASGLAFHRTALPRGMKVSLRLEDATILESLSELGRAGSFLILGVEGARIYLQPGVPAARPRAFHGPVMIELERISRRTRLGFDATTRDFWLRLALWWEPRVLPLDGPLACVVTRAVDDQGRSLLSDAPPAAQARVDAYPRAGHAMATVEGLRPPAADALSMTVEGYVELRFPARVELAAFEKPGVVERPGVRIELKSFAAAEAGGTLAEIRLRFDDRARAAEHRPAAADVALEGEDSTMGPRPALTAPEVKEHEVEFGVRAPSRRFEDVARVVVRVPEGVVVKRVPFRFDEVDLK
ncbi:MAG TPA: hypothetical protein VF950_11070 [Planctomycetota bacterium]